MYQLLIFQIEYVTVIQSTTTFTIFQTFYHFHHFFLLFSCRLCVKWVRWSFAKYDHPGLFSQFQIRHDQIFPRFGSFESVHTLAEKFALYVEDYEFEKLHSTCVSSECSCGCEECFSKAAPSNVTGDSFSLQCVAVSSHTRSLTDLDRLVRHSVITREVFDRQTLSASPAICDLAA